MLVLSLGTVILALFVPRTDVIDAQIKSVAEPPSE
jgi:hypothetical protein